MDSQPGGPNTRPGACSQTSGDDGASWTDLADQWRDRVTGARQIARQRGDLPVGEQLDRLVVAIDTSGSVTEYVAEFISKLSGIPGLLRSRLDHGDDLRTPEHETRTWGRMIVLVELSG